MTLETEGSSPPEAPSDGAGMVDRVKRILLEPKTEWNRIDAEPMTVAGIFKGWVAPLAAIPAVATFIGLVVFGTSVLGFTVKFGVVQALGTAITMYVLSLVGVFLVSLLIDVLAPTFGGTKNQVQATKVAAYSYTASWVAGVFNVLPALSILTILGLYSLYLLYLGLPKLMKTPEDKALPYIAAVIVAGIVVGIIIAALTAPIAGMFGGRPGIPTTEMSGTVNLPGGGSIDLGKFDQASKKMEAAAKRMEAGTAQAAVPPATLQALLPETLGAYRRVEMSSASAGAGGVGGSSAEARYENGDSQFELRVNDIAAVGALAAMGSAFNVESSRQTETSYERTGKVAGRMTTEKWDSSSSRGEYGILVADRFMVHASGKVPQVDVLKSAVNAIGIAKLESLAG